MDLLEYQGKQLFRAHGVPVPDGRPASTAPEAVEAAEELGYPVVVKAQVLIGGRGKAGGIKLAQDRAGVEEAAGAILGMDIRGFTVHELYVERASDIAEEYYAAILLDRTAKKPMAMLSRMGGMDVEEIADKDPNAIVRVHVDPLTGFSDFHARRLAFEAGIAADVYRHPDTAAFRDVGSEDPQERMAKERGLTFVKLDGDIGILGNGAGLVMSTLDVVAQAGGHPANFLDAGGGSKAEAIVDAVEVILSNENVRAVLFNIFGGITRCDEVARGLVTAFGQIDVKVPFVVRLDGTNDEEGRRILEAADAGVELVICITEGIPVHDMLRVYTHLRRGGRTRLIGPNCPGVLSPGKANVGIIPAPFFSEGNVGLVSRSGTLTYQIGNELAQRGFGNSSIVGIGGDPVPGSSFVDIIALFQDDPETELIVMAGEIGGSAEEEAAEYIAENVTKPVVAYIAGVTAPPGKTMGHAGAIVSGSSGGAAAKAEALEAK